MKTIIILILILVLWITTIYSQSNQDILIIEQVNKNKDFLKFQEAELQILQNFPQIKRVRYSTPSNIDTIFNKYKFKNRIDYNLHSLLVGKLFNVRLIIQQVYKNSTNSDPTYIVYDTYKKEFIKQFYFKTLPKRIDKTFNKYLFMITDILGERSATKTYADSDILELSSQISIIDSLNQHKVNSGILIIETNIEDAQVYLDKKLIGNSSSIIRDVKKGIHLITIQKNDYATYDTTFYLKENEIRKIRILYKKAWMTFNGTPDSMDVTIKRYYPPRQFGTPLKQAEIGETPLNQIEMLPGYYIFDIEKFGYRSKKLKLKLKPMNEEIFDINLEKFQKCKALIFSVIFPGMGQLYSEQYNDALIWSSLTIMGLGYIHWANHKLDNDILTYKDLKQQYLNAINEDYANYYYEQADDVNKKITKTKEIRNIIITATVFTYCLNILDIYLAWPYKKNKKINNIKTNTSYSTTDKSINFRIHINL